MAALALSLSAQAAQAAQPPVTRPCGDPFAFQVLLDRRGFSPGVIESKIGSNTSNALAAFQTAHGLEPTGQPDCATWEKLGGKSGEPTTVTYRLTEDDLKGPFAPKIPADLQRQAALPAMSYRSALESLAERFHTTPAVLQKMNPKTQFSAGREISVPNVTPFDPHAKRPRDPAAPEVTIQVSRDQLRAMGPDGSVIFFAPVSSGTVHDPLPAGDYKVTGVGWHPTFNYNPELFWDANPKHTKATIKAGPNNPVGVVWIDISLEHYGLHGTPEPVNIGHTQSHGCVRLTNWDVARLATLVKPGTPVLFR